MVSTHLKKIRQNWIISPNRVENNKYLKSPPSQTSILNWWAGRGSRLILSFFMTQKLTTVDHRIFRHVFTVRNLAPLFPRVPQAAREGYTIHDAATKSQSASEWPAKPNKQKAEHRQIWVETSCVIWSSKTNDNKESWKLNFFISSGGENFANPKLPFRLFDLWFLHYHVPKLSKTSLVFVWSRLVDLYVNQAAKKHCFHQYLDPAWYHMVSPAMFPNMYVLRRLPSATNRDGIDKALGPLSVWIMP